MAAPESDRARSLRAHLLVIIAAVAVVSLTVGAWVSARSFSQARRTANRDVAFQASLAGREVTSSVALAQSVMAASASGVAAVFGTPSDQCTLSFNGVGSFPAGHLDVVGPDGTVVCSSLTPSGVPTGASHAGEPWVAHLATSATPVTETSVDRLTQKPSLVVAVPVTGGTGARLGSLAAVLSVEGLAPMLARTYGGREHFEFLVTDRAGNVLSSSSAPARAGSSVARTGLAKGRPGSFRGIDGVRRLYGLDAVPALDWRVWTGLEQDTALAPAKAELRRLATVVAASLLALVAVAMLVNRRIIRPVGELTAVVVGGRGADRATVAGPRELAHLAAEFNSMLERREETETRLKEVNARLQEALALLSRSREDERRVIATILHDDALQTLTSAMWQLDGVESGDDLDRRRRGINATRSALEATLASMRNLMLELRPPALDELGLSAAVAELLEGLQAETSAGVELEDRLADRLPEQVETLAFRTIQEALRNVRKHAKASHVAVHLNSDGRRLEVSVTDDGVGIEPGELGRRAAAGHLGVRSMREFVVLAGGEFSIRPGTEGGTEVSFSLPLSVSVPA